MKSDDYEEAGKEPGGEYSTVAELFFLVTESPVGLDTVSGLGTAFRCPRVGSHRSFSTHTSAHLFPLLYLRSGEVRQTQRRDR